MTKRIRPYVQVLGAAALLAQALIFPSCGGGNEGMTGNGTGNGGTTGSGTGSAGTTGASGATGSAGASGSAGATGAGGSMPFGEPACTGLRTAAGEEPAKNVPCTPADPQFCFRTCGPVREGIKSETCETSGVYAEMSGCTFDPGKNYSCYKIPAAANPVCPVGMTPKGSDPCTDLNVPTCTACNSLQGLNGGQYFDSAGSPKTGWCVCQAPNGQGVRTWSCASDTAWPCPFGAGCV
jgi:hypothetical protein